MDSKYRKQLIILSALGTIILITDVILFFGAEVISGTAFGVTALISAPLAIVPALFLIAPEEMAERWKASRKPDYGWMPRTREGSIMEAVAAILLIGAWTIALTRHQFADGIEGNPQVMLIIMTFTAVVLMVAAYNPRYINTGVEVTNERQLFLAVRMTRVIAIELALMLLCDEITGGLLLTDSALMTVTVSIIVLTALLFIFLIWREK